MADAVLKISDSCTILHNLEHSLEVTACISDCRIIYVDKHSGLIYPEIGMILLSVSELFDNFFHQMHTFSWMTVLHISTYYILTSWENPMVCIRIKLNYFILIHKRYVKRKILEYHVYLIKC